MTKIIIATLTLFLSVTSAANTKAPKKAADFKDTTVMITNKEKSSGGTGVIYKSDGSGSYVLTNAHICRLLARNGGTVTTSNGSYSASRFKISKVHDICLVEVVSDLEVQTKLATARPKFGDKLIVAGHPYLLPTTVTEGHLSGQEEIQLLVDVQKCSKEEFEKDPFLCFYFDGMPMIQSFQADTTSVMIAPGNSGSGVFNAEGELVGLAFAGIGRGISHGFIVPLESVKAFLNKEIKEKSCEWVTLTGAKKWTDLESGESYNRNNMRKFTAPTRENIEKVFYPAVKDSRVDTLVERLESCRKGLEKCIRN